MQKKNSPAAGPLPGVALSGEQPPAARCAGAQGAKKRGYHTFVQKSRFSFCLFLRSHSLYIFLFFFFFAFNMYLFSFSFFFRARSLCIYFLLFFLHTHSLYTCALTRYLCECGFSERYHSCVFHFFSFLFFPCRCSLLFVVRYRSLLYVVLFYFVQFFLYGLLVCVICVVYMFCLHLCVCVCGLVFV